MRTPFLAFMLALLVGATFAAPAWAADNGEARVNLRADTSNIHRFTLDNGLEVVVVEDHNVPIVTIEMAVRNGAFAEDVETNGLSHLYEHMFFKANARYKSQEEYMERQRELGMAWNGTTSTERVNYFFTLPQELVDEGLEFMADALLTPSFDPVELEREKEVVHGEYDRSEANPFWYLWRGTADLLWYEHPHRKNPIGSREAISAANVEQMLAMKGTYYVPNNSLLVLSGDIQPHEGLALAKKHFSHWEAGDDPNVVRPVPEHPPLKENAAAVIGRPVGISFVQMAWHGPNTRETVGDTYAADVASYALSQATSALQQALVDSGIALNASISYHTQRYTGPIYFSAATTQGNEAALIAAMNEEIEKLTAGPYIADELLETAKTTVAVNDLSTQQSSLDLAHTISYWWCSADIDYYLNYIDNIQQVTQDDVQSFFQQWMKDQPRVTVLLTSPDVAEAWSDERLLETVHGEVSQ